MTPENDEPNGAKPSMNETGYSELLLRIGSAIVLGGLALFAAYSGIWSFLFLVTLGVAILLWEWAGIVRKNGFDGAYFISVGAVLASCIAMVTGYGALSIIPIMVGACLVFLIRRSKEDALWSALGVIYAGFPAIALIWFRGDEIIEWLVIWFLFLVVWMADTGAYISGRLIGGPKLSPRISPNKTWAGFIGGILFAACVGIAAGYYGPRESLYYLIIVAVSLAIISQLGDLLESAIKRRFGTKNSSNLIPGHGGIFDRVDGLLMAVLGAAVIALFHNAAQPGAGLLIWP